MDGTPGYTRRTAEVTLQAILTDARRGTLEGMTQNGTTAADAAAAWLRHADFERELKHSTLRGYRSMVSAHLVPVKKAF